MTFETKLIAESTELANKIKEAEKLNKPIDNLVKRHIKVLEAHYDEFVKQANKNNIHNLNRAKIEIELYSNIKAWANKIGLPVDKYDKAINKIRVENLGEENVKNFFSK